MEHKGSINFKDEEPKKGAGDLTLYKETITQGERAGLFFSSLNKQWD